MRPSENRLRDSREHECTFVVAWEQASWWGKGKTIVSGGVGGSRGGAPHFPFSGYFFSSSLRIAFSHASLWRKYIHPN